MSKRKIILLAAEEILNSLNNKEVEIEIFNTIDSTFSYLQSMSPKNHVRIVLAEEQRAGIGRKGGRWHSPKFENIYLTLAVPIAIANIDSANLTQNISKLIIRVLEELLAIDELKLKVPNDILYRGMKLCGSMVDLRDGINCSKELIIGIGLNVNMVGSLDVGQPWTSLSMIVGKHLDRNMLIASIVNSILAWLEKVELVGGQMDTM